jgi:response regulator RpfG family c-di-GMP phosphodiesterase
MTIAAAGAQTRPKILCVDDEPRIVEGLALHLRRKYEVIPAGDGVKGLEALISDPTIQVVISDMRMPGMDGATFLSRSRQVVPDAIRLLLTGQADIESAIAAVNDGQIFRFLTKPCPPGTLLAAVAAAVEQHRLVTAERELLEKTLHGAIRALTDILALSDPVSFGRALRIKACVAELAERQGLEDRWRFDVAAMFSQLGLITLPRATVEKLHSGRLLSPEEQEMVSRLPEVTAGLLSGIPRMEEIRRMLAMSRQPFRSPGAGRDSQELAILQGANLLRVALDFDVLEIQGEPADRAVAIMRGRPGAYDPALLDALEGMHVLELRAMEIRELPVSALRVGMVVADDVRFTSGPILVARGYEITERFVERVRNFAPNSIEQPVRVIVHAMLPTAEKP